MFEIYIVRPDVLKYEQLVRSELKDMTWIPNIEYMVYKLEKLPIVTSYTLYVCLKVPRVRPSTARLKNNERSLIVSKSIYRR